MIDQTTSVSWPVLIRVRGHSELLSVASAQRLADPQWCDDAGLSPDFAANPLLAAALEFIDSDGRVFTVQLKAKDSFSYRSTEQRYELNEVVQFVQQHAALLGHCCVAKVGAGSIQQAIQLVEHLNSE